MPRPARGDVIAIVDVIVVVDSLVIIMPVVLRPLTLVAIVLPDVLPDVIPIPDVIPALLLVIVRTDGDDVDVDADAEGVLTPPPPPSWSQMRSWRRDGGTTTTMTRQMRSDHYSFSPRRVSLLSVLHGNEPCARGRWLFGGQ